MSSVLIVGQSSQAKTIFAYRLASRLNQAESFRRWQGEQAVPFQVVLERLVDHTAGVISLAPYFGLIRESRPALVILVQPSRTTERQGRLESDMVEEAAALVLCIGTLAPLRIVVEDQIEDPGLIEQIALALETLLYSELAPPLLPLIQRSEKLPV